MAIKIIKKGKVKERKVVKFTKTCPDCGCEFEYEAEDIKIDYTTCLTSNPCRYNTFVVCPCCEKHVWHGYTEPDFTSYPNMVWTTLGTCYEYLDCDKCPNKPNPEKIVFGDTPCTWCNKNQPYCITGDISPENYKPGSITSFLLNEEK